MTKWKWSDLEIGDKIKINKNIHDKYCCWDYFKTLAVINIYNYFDGVIGVEVTDGLHFDIHYINKNGYRPYQKNEEMPFFEIVELKEE